MKALIFKKNGELFLLNRFTQEEEKVETVKNYLDCPTILEDGITFETFFNHIIKEKEFFNIVYSETMGESSIDNFIEEWELPSTDILTQKGLTYLKAYKIFDYIELMDKNNFIDIRIDFDGIGKEEELYNVEFIPLNELKNLPLYLSDQISIYRTVSNLRGEELFFKGNTFTLLFELIGTILYVLTIHNTPTSRESAKHKFIKIIGETNIIDLLEQQKEEAVEIQNFEEAAQLKKILDRLRNGFIDD
mgnify:CR=1 FL=1